MVAIKELPFADLQVPVPVSGSAAILSEAQSDDAKGYGAMGLSFAYGPTIREESKKTFKKVIELGCTFIDTAVIYGLGENESLIGEVIKELGCREKLFIASKCGFEVNFETKERIGVNNNPAHIREYLEGTTQRLGFAPDLYYLHRIDPKTPIEKAMETLEELRKEKKLKYIGLSECSVETLRKACKVGHVDAVQVEYSMWETFAEKKGGLLDTCKELGVALIAYSPLGRGLISGEIKSIDDLAEDDFRRSVPRFQGENFKKNLEIVDKIKVLADKKGCTNSQLALAWVSAQGAIPIPGTKRIGTLQENWDSRKIDLSEQDLKELRAVVDAAKPVGDRYPSAIMHTLDQ